MPQILYAALAETLAGSTGTGQRWYPAGAGSAIVESGIFNCGKFRMPDQISAAMAHKPVILLAPDTELVVLDPALGVVERSAAELRAGDEILVQSVGRACFRQIMTVEIVPFPQNGIELPAGALAPCVPKRAMRLVRTQEVAVAFPAGAPRRADSVTSPAATHPLKSRSSPEPAAPWLCVTLAEADRLIAGGLAIVVPERQPVAAAPRETGPPLRALVGIRELPIDAATLGESRLSLCFTVPPRTATLRLSSPVGRPHGEQRKLGVAIVSLMLGEEAIPLDSPALIRGFYRPEADETLAWRWTDGEALLVLTSRPATQTLTVVTTTWHEALQKD